MLNHGYVGTEHMLIALLTTDLPAAETMKAIGVEQEAVRQAVIELIGFGLAPAPVHIVFTRNARRVLIKAAEVAGSTPRILPEHLLMALIEEGKGVGVDALKHLGTNLEAALSKLRTSVDTDTQPENAPGLTSEPKVNHV